MGDILIAPRSDEICTVADTRHAVGIQLNNGVQQCVKEIETLEKTKTSAASMYALIVAIIGAAYIAVSTFAMTAHPPYIILSAILAVPGFIGWIILCFL